MVTVGEALAAPNVPVDATATKGGQNTQVDDGILPPNNWRPWADFTYDTLVRIFGHRLDKAYRGGPEPRPLPRDLAIFNEESFDDLVRRFVTPVVNHALNKRRDGSDSAHYGRGSRVPNITFKPDWSLAPETSAQNAKTVFTTNLVPGDTKINSKWWPDMRDEEEWGKVLQQILTYMAFHGSRYGFIITDAYLVVLRLTRQNIVSNRTAGQSSRSAAVQYHRLSGGSTMTAASDSTFRDDNPLTWAYQDPEYAAVSWADYGSGRLTVKLALWWLALLATEGPNDIGYEYPPLDSWQPRARGRGYIHNTSGERSTTLPSGATIYSPPSLLDDLAGAQQPSTQQPSAQHPSAAAVWEENEIVVNTGPYGYHYDDEGEAGPSTAPGSGVDEPQFSQVATPSPFDNAGEWAGYDGEAVEGYHSYDYGSYEGGYAGGYPSGGGVGGEQEEEDDDDNRTVVDAQTTKSTAKTKKGKGGGSQEKKKKRGGSRR